jgi:hypothetical protein
LGLAVCAATFGVRLFLLGTDQAAYLIDATVLPVIVWLAAFALLATESNRWPALRNEAMPGLATLINFALLAFLVQDTINFASFVPGAATTLFALAAVPFACRAVAADDGTPADNEADSSSDQRTGRDATAWLPVVLMALVLLAHVQWLLKPVARSNAELARAREWTGRVVAGEYFVQPSHLAYMRATGADPLDPTPWAEGAGFLIGYAESASQPGTPLVAAFELMDAAIQRDPYSTKRYRQKVRMCVRAFALTGNEHYLLTALEPGRRVVELYPQSPAAQADLGTALLNAGKSTMDDEMLSQALQHLTRALDLDEARPDWEELRRMPVRRRQEIETQIAEAQLLLGSAGE